MFDPQIVGRDMDRIFSRPTAAGRVERPSNIKVLSVARNSPAMPPGPAPARRRSRIGRKGLAVAAVLLVVPALALAALYAIGAWPPSDGRRGATSTIAATPAPDARPPQAATAPRHDATAYAVVEQKSVSLANAAHARWHWRRTRRAGTRSAAASSAADATLDQAIAEDASITRRLNQAALQAQPTLGYSQGVADQSTPR